MASQTSASASFHGLPASNTSSAARSCRRARIHWAARKSTPARASAGVRLQLAHDRCATAIASSASCAPHDADRATCTEGAAGSTDVIDDDVVTGRPSIIAGTSRPNASPALATADAKADRTRVSLAGRVGSDERLDDSDDRNDALMGSTLLVRDAGEDGPEPPAGQHWTAQ